MPAPCEEQQEYPRTGDVVPPELVEAVKLEVPPVLTLPAATSSVTPSRWCQGPSWCSGIQDQGRIFTWAYCEPEGAFCLPAPPNCSTIYPGYAGTCFLGTHGLTFWISRGVAANCYNISSGPYTTFFSSWREENEGFFPPFSIRRWLLATSSHSFSHTEWKNTSKSGATWSKFWARLRWNISLPGKLNIWHSMNTFPSLRVMVYFAVGFLVIAEETLKTRGLLSLHCCSCVETQPRGLCQPPTGMHLATSALWRDIWL